MADPLHEYTVQEVLNKTNNYNSYHYVKYEGTPGIGGHADRSADLGITATNPAQELTILELSSSTGPIQITINDGDHIYLASGDAATDGVYTAGKFIIKMYGALADFS